MNQNNFHSKLQNSVQLSIHLILQIINFNNYKCLD